MIISMSNWHSVEKLVTQTFLIFGRIFILIKFWQFEVFLKCCCSIIFSSPGPKVQVNYCHHLASVVCKLFTFQASPRPLGRLEPNLAGMFLGWPSTKLLFFVLVGYSIWLPGPIMCSDWLKFQRSSSLKLMNWLNPNCTWMIIGMSFTKLLFFMPIGNPRWPPSQDID